MLKLNVLLPLSSDNVFNLSLNFEKIMNMNKKLSFLISIVAVVFLFTSCEINVQFGSERECYCAPAAFNPENGQFIPPSGSVEVVYVEDDCSEVDYYDMCFEMQEIIDAYPEYIWEYNCWEVDANGNIIN